MPRFLTAGMFVLKAALAALSYEAAPLDNALVQATAQNGPVKVGVCFGGPVGQEITAFLTFQLEPECHLYWVNPGDSGLAPEARWTLPPGWRAGPLEHPVPHALKDEAGLTYVHEGTFTLRARLKGPANQKPRGAFAVDLDWLVCEESCIPGQARLSGKLEDASLRMKADEQKRFEAVLPSLPWPGLNVGAARLEKHAGTWTLHAPLSGAAGADAFFPEAPAGFSVIHGEVRATPTSLVVPLVPAGPDSRLRELRGVLRLGNRAVALVIPFSGKE